MWGLLTGFIGKIFGSAVSGAGSIVSSTVSKTGDLLTAAFKDPGDLQSARQFAAPGQGGGVFRDFIDGINCAIRPGIVIYLGGLIAGWWPAPDISSVNPVYLEWFQMVMIFYFGQRAVMYDLPRLIAGLRKAFRS
jgi:hypothetical protein